MTLPTDICGALKGALERLCIAQVHATHQAHRTELQGAVDTVNRLGVWYCPQWSKFDEPDVPESPYCEAQVGGMECGQPVERWGQQCPKHDPEGITRRATSGQPPTPENVDNGPFSPGRQ